MKLTDIVKTTALIAAATTLMPAQAQGQFLKLGTRAEYSTSTQQAGARMRLKGALPQGGIVIGGILDADLGDTAPNAYGRATIGVTNGPRAVMDVTPTSNKPGIAWYEILNKRMDGRLNGLVNAAYVKDIGFKAVIDADIQVSDHLEIGTASVWQQNGGFIGEIRANIVDVDMLTDHLYQDAKLQAFARNLGSALPNAYGIGVQVKLPGGQ